MQEERIRAFIAIELPVEMKHRLREFQVGFLRLQHTFVKWVSPDSVHLTLKFLGDISAGQSDRISASLKSIATGHSIFALYTTETGCFPNLQRVRVFWLGLGGEIDKILNLQKAVDIQMTKLGFPSESRPYTAHLTLARVKDDSALNQRLEFAELIKGKQFMPEFVIKVNSIVLMRSRLTPNGAIYTRLSEHSLIQQ